MKNKVLTFGDADKLNESLDQYEFSEAVMSPIKKVYKANDGIWYVWIIDEYLKTKEETTLSTWLTKFSFLPHGYLLRNL